MPSWLTPLWRGEHVHPSRQNTKSIRDNHQKTGFKYRIQRSLTMAEADKMEKLLSAMDQQTALLGKIIETIGGIDQRVKKIESAL